MKILWWWLSIIYSYSTTNTRTNITQNIGLEMISDKSDLEIRELKSNKLIAFHQKKLLNDETRPSFSNFKIWSAHHWNEVSSGEFSELMPILLKRRCASRLWEGIDQQSTSVKWNLAPPYHTRGADRFSLKNNKDFIDFSREQSSGSQNCIKLNITRNALWPANVPMYISV